MASVPPLIRLARFTRRFSRQKQPIAYRLCGQLLRIVYPKRKRSRPVRTVMPYDNGLIHVDTSSRIEYAIMFRGCYEPEIVRLIKRVVKPGDVCIDVGANIGAHTLVMAFAAGEQGMVIALEPHPELAARLRQNVALNRLRQVQIVDAALSESDGSATLYAFDEAAFNRGVSSLKPMSADQPAIPVRTISPRTLQKECGLARCDLIKVDVEGHEMAVLRGLLDVIRRFRPYVIFEYEEPQWQRFGGRIEEALAQLRRMDYGIHVVERQTTFPLGARIPSNCEFFCVPARRGTTDGEP